MSLAKTIASIGLEKDAMQREPIGVTMSYMLFTSGNLKIRVSEVKIEERSYNTTNQVLILSHPTYGTLNNHKLGNESTYPAFDSWTTVEDITLVDKITHDGKTEILKFMDGDTSDYPQYIALGTGNSTYLDTQTELDSEVARYEATISSATGEVTYETILTTVDENGTTFKEVGLFNADSGGEMFHRTPISDYLKVDSKEMKITYKITLTNTLPITDVGRESIKNWLAGESVTRPTYVAWGTGSNPISTSDTALESEVQRNSIVLDRRTATYEELEAVLSTSQGNGNDISRIALFNANSGGDMWMIKDIAPISKTSNIQIQTTFRFGIN